MDLEVIESLLNKYFEGESSLEEEKILSEYFNHADVPTHLKKYQPLFTFFAAEKQIKLPISGAEFRISAQPKTRNPKLKITNHKNIFKVVRVAAILLLLFGSLHWYRASVETQPIIVAPIVDNALHDTEDSPEVAYAKAKAALMLVSNKMKRGTDKGSAGLMMVRSSLDKIK